MQKLQLDINVLNNDFFEGTRLLGIIAPVKNYQLCLQLNTSFGFNFRLNTDIEIIIKRKGRDYIFSIFQSPESNNTLHHYLYNNHYDGEYLLPEFKHMDFLWLLKDGFIEEEKLNWIKESIRSIKGVQMVAELSPDQIKNKGNMVFE